MPIPKISFEFFPPRSIDGTFALMNAVQMLFPLRPRFASVTYGAGGTTRDLTRDTLQAIQKNFDQRLAGHLTCVNASKAETLDVAQGYYDIGIRDIVALRGDAPDGAAKFTPHPDGYNSSHALISALADTGRYNIIVGAYPEKHPDAKNHADDLAWLKAKIDAGASEAITQFFFEAETFLRFRDRCAKAGITAPITPGILPIENWENTRKFAQKCGANIPNILQSAFTNAENQAQKDLLSTAVCSELCHVLIAEGVDRLHFYTLNRPNITRDICALIGVSAPIDLKNVA